MVATVPVDLCIDVVYFAYWATEMLKMGFSGDS
jgi:hypothetical protein